MYYAATQNFVNNRHQNQLFDAFNNSDSEKRFWFRGESSSYVATSIIAVDVLSKDRLQQG